MILEGEAGISSNFHSIENLFSRSVWHHIGLTYDDSLSNATVYLDGDPVWTEVIEDLTETTNMPFIYIGQIFIKYGPSVVPSRMTGRIACLGIHNGLLKEADIEEDLGKCFREEGMCNTCATPVLPCCLLP